MLSGLSVTGVHVDSCVCGSGSFRLNLTTAVLGSVVLVKHLVLVCKGFVL